jgi:hypothetical protein
MKFVPSPKKDAAEPLFNFNINAREEALLLATLRLYPVLPNGHHRISQDPKTAGSAEQRLLEESMAQHRAAHRRKLDELFRSPQRFFKDAQDERRLVLTGAQLEWLLQVLNDIKVGSWVQLGCPDLEKTASAEPIRSNARSLQAMQLSGGFQSVLLDAVK